MTVLKVVIATHGRNTRLARTLESLSGCALPDGYAGLIVAENGGRLGAEDIVRRAPPQLRATYLYREEANKDAALNASIGNLPDDCLVFFADDDVRFSPDLLTTYAAAADGHDGGTFFGGPTDVDYEEPPAKWLVPHLPDSARGWSPDPTRVDPATVNFLGYNWAAFAGDLKRAGLFDTRLGGALTGGPMRDEFDMQNRLRARGAAARYLPTARVWHHIPTGRCTPDWVANRRHRGGVVDGLTRSANSGLGFAAYLLGVGAVKFVAASLRGSRGRQFAARCTFTYSLGVIRGRWMRFRGTPA